jgi:hypothetical protein
MTTEIPQQTITEEFAKCWQTAGRHLVKQSDSPLSWIKASLDGLIMEHFSFRLGNQIVFIQIEDVDQQMFYPSQREAFLKKAKAWNGHACLMPMKKFGEEWRPMLPNWGLQDAITKELLIPPALITDEEIEITDNELLDLAVQIVRDKLIEEGRTIQSTQSDPMVNPSIWFADGDKLSWVVVKAARYPVKSAPRPHNMDEMTQSLRRSGYSGYFASVAVANANDPFDPTAEKTGNYLPLFRGTGYRCFFKGLETAT